MNDKHEISFSEMVALELKQLKRLGVPVSENAITSTKDAELMSEYTDMKVSECADLLMNLYP